MQMPALSSKLLASKGGWVSKRVRFQEASCSSEQGQPGGLVCRCASLEGKPCSSKELQGDEPLAAATAAIA